MPEAVFSSTGFRIRAAQGQAADHGLAKHELTDHGLAKHGLAVFAERVAANLFFTLFPADRRICNSPLLRVSRSIHFLKFQPVRPSAVVIPQAALKELSRPKRFVLDTGILRRRETGSHIGFTRRCRRENTRGAFAVGDPTRILKRDILLLVNDVSPGMTAYECARVLLCAGAARVGVATVARSLKLSVSDGIVLPEDLSEKGSEERSEGSSEDRFDLAARV